MGAVNANRVFGGPEGERIMRLNMLSQHGSAGSGPSPDDSHSQPSGAGYGSEAVSIDERRPSLTLVANISRHAAFGLLGT